MRTLWGRKICHDSESTVTNYRPCSSTPCLLKELRVSAFEKYNNITGCWGISPLCLRQLSLVPVCLIYLLGINVLTLCARSYLHKSHVNICLCAPGSCTSPKVVVANNLSTRTKDLGFEWSGYVKANMGSRRANRLDYKSVVLLWRGKKLLVHNKRLNLLYWSHLNDIP